MLRDKQRLLCPFLGRPFVKLFKCVTPWANHRSMTNVTRGSGTKGPPSQWKLPTPQI